ncbi:3,4-dihydroxy-2-butanone-4-phosphate synthase [Fructilactobacillus frigidiflavus]|uniref:3,4-dihydroxy-2-butanone-4-phosphate synthase n=1 Tax=Fructilactobacillus frigidiflavus TaxID=3242688 RepID=UPI0037574FF2
MLQTDVKERMEQAIQDLKAGKLIVVQDDVDREGEGDLIGAAEFVTPENVNTMVTKAKGLLCAPSWP